MEEAMKKHKLPKTDSVQELAKFWDSHDLADFEDQLEEITEPVFVRSSAIVLRLKPGQTKLVQEIAQAKGVSREELIGQWIAEKLARRNGRSPNGRGVSRRRPRTTKK